MKKYQKSYVHDVLQLMTWIACVIPVSLTFLLMHFILLIRRFNLWRSEPEKGTNNNVFKALVYIGCKRLSVRALPQFILTNVLLVYAGKAVRQEHRIFV